MVNRWSSIFLDVPTGKPEFVPETRQAKVGENVRLKCALTDWHVSWRMIWYGNGEMIRPRMDSRFRLVIGKSSFLVINDVRKGDAGIFECVSSNAFGTVSKKFKLTVVGKFDKELHTEVKNNSIVTKKMS